MAPEDEADDVRALLDRHHIPWFETSAGRFGVSFPAIWLVDDDDWPRAKTLLDDYQQERSARVRRFQQEQAESGNAETFLSRMLSHPLQLTVVLCAVLVIAYFSVVPFFSLLKQ
jgi:hypothetical protein